ncbi:MAG TPA: hypothetical protein EYP68_01150 [Candidatus Korarchaeota archaeon]|nr:hypothetical protein [Candidatus Korarchaeota archaeon]
MTLLYGTILVSLYLFSDEICGREPKWSLFWQFESSYDGLRDIFRIFILGGYVGAISYLQSFMSFGFSGFLTFLFLPAFINLENPFSGVQAILYWWTSLYGFSDSTSLLLAWRLGKRKKLSSLLKYAAISALGSSLVLSIVLLVGDFNLYGLAFPSCYLLLPSLAGITLIGYMCNGSGTRTSFLSLSLSAASFIFALLNWFRSALTSLALMIIPLFLFKLSELSGIPDEALENESPTNLVKDARKLGKIRLALSAIFTGVTAYLNDLYLLPSFIGFLGVLIKEIHFYLFLRLLRRTGSSEIKEARSLLNSGDVENSVLIIFPWFIRMISKALELKPRDLRSIADPNGKGIRRLLWAAFNPSEADNRDLEEIFLLLES